MKKNIFINHSVNDLEKSIAFYAALGFASDPKMSGKESTKINIDDNIFLMLHTKTKFKEFTRKKVVANKSVMETVLALPCESKAEVDEIFQKAMNAGGKEALDVQDYGSMYLRTFEDLDGHVWELYWQK